MVNHTWIWRSNNKKPSSTSPFPRSDASTFRGGRRVRDVACQGNPGGGGMDGVKYITYDDLFVQRLGPKTWDFMISWIFCLKYEEVLDFCRTECWMDGVCIGFCFVCTSHYFLVGKDWSRTKNRILTFWIHHRTQVRTSYWVQSQGCPRWSFGWCLGAAVGFLKIMMMITSTW